MVIRIPIKATIFLGIAIVIGAWFLAGSNNPQSQPSTDQALVQNSIQSDNAASKSNTVEFNVTAKQFSFEPNPIRVKLGDRVRLNITSIDVTHGFSLPDFGISEVLEPGKTTSVEFIANKKGRFAFYCSIVCGAGHTGMRGNIIVE